MPADHLQADLHHQPGSGHDRGAGRDQRIPARHWGPAAGAPGGQKGRTAQQEDEEEEGDSLDAFVVETRLVPVSLSQIPDQLPDHLRSLFSASGQSYQSLSQPTFRVW